MTQRPIAQRRLSAITDHSDPHPSVKPTPCGFQLPPKRDARPLELALQHSYPGLPIEIIPSGYAVTVLTQPRTWTERESIIANTALARIHQRLS